MRVRGAAVVYGAGLLQGFSFTLVPALATIFSAAPYGIHPRGFGSLFIPVTLGAVAGAAWAPRFARRHTMLVVLRLGIVANICALAALLASSGSHGLVAYLLLLVDTSALGFGFGLTFAAVNELASSLSTNQTASVTLANVLTGFGTSLTPMLVAAFVALRAWTVWPALLIVAFATVLAVSYGWCVPARVPGATFARGVSRTLLLFGFAALLYAFCEGAFSSWATTFAHDERGFSLATGEAALSAFWLALTLVRLIAVAATRVLAPRVAFAAFPLLIAGAFLALPFWATPALLVAGYALAGAACSIVFPYAMSLALTAMPQDRDRVAGVLVAALMTGEGFGTFIVGVIHGTWAVTLATIYRASVGVALALWIVALLSGSAAPERRTASGR